jgi:hypothetical protein
MICNDMSVYSDRTEQNIDGVTSPNINLVECVLGGRRTCEFNKRAIEFADIASKCHCRLLSQRE